MTATNPKLETSPMRVLAKSKLGCERIGPFDLSLQAADLMHKSSSNYLLSFFGWALGHVISLVKVIYWNWPLVLKLDPRLRAQEEM